jgi:hypothetical protein
MLAIALSSNGEIMLAQADLIRMDARLNQTRLQMTEEVTIAFQTGRVKKNALNNAEKVLQMIKERGSQGIVSKEEELSAFQAKIEAEAELARIEAHIRYLLGLGGTVHSRKRSESGSAK